MILHPFGPRDQQCFGAYEPAQAPRRRRAVLLLQPVGWEYLRAHRSLELLARQLAAAGCDTFRFDYAGTGDSWGDEAEQSLEQWLQDIGDAAEELQALANVARVSLVGVRLGARLALEIAARGALKLDRLVLWDPTALEHDALRADATVAVGVDAFGGGQATDEAPVLREPPWVLEALRQSAAHQRLPGTVPTLLVTSNGIPTAPELAALPHETLTSSEPPCWVEERTFGAGAVPATLLGGIVSWLGT